MVDVLGGIRLSELALLRKMLVFNALSQLALQAGPVLVALASFAVFAWSQPGPLTPDKAFTAITLFSIFRLPLQMLPRIFQLVFQANVSIARLQEFLDTPELRDRALDRDQSSSDLLFGHADTPADAKQLPPLIQPTVKATGVPLGMKHASFSVGKKAAPPAGPVAGEADATPSSSSSSSSSNLVLENVNFLLPKGELTLIVGPVGSGKSTLLAAMLGELESTRGVVQMTTNVAYVAQSAYIINASVQGMVLPVYVGCMSRTDHIYCVYFLLFQTIYCLAVRTTRPGCRTWSSGANWRPTWRCSRAAACRARLASAA